MFQWKICQEAESAHQARKPLMLSRRTQNTRRVGATYSLHMTVVSPPIATEVEESRERVRERQREAEEKEARKWRRGESEWWAFLDSKLGLHLSEVVN